METKDVLHFLSCLLYNFLTKSICSFVYKNSSSRNIILNAKVNIGSSTDISTVHQISFIMAYCMNERKKETLFFQ